MGIKWSARLTVDFEIEEGVAADLAGRNCVSQQLSFNALSKLDMATVAPASNPDLPMS
jgi:hypothetical protein